MKKNISLLVIGLVALSGMSCQFAYRLINPVANATSPTPIEMVETSIAVMTLPVSEPTFTQVSPTVTATPVLEVTVNPVQSPVSPHGTPQVTPTPLGERLQRNIFLEIWEAVNDYYLYEDFNGADWGTIRKTYGAKIAAGLTNDEFYITMNEMIGELGDDHSVYLSPEAQAADDLELTGQHDYVGIGVYINASMERGGALVLATFPGSPAEQAGIMPRDVILTVDGETVLDDDGFIKPIVRGPEDSQALFRVQTPGEEVREITIQRKRITGQMSLPYNVLTTPDGRRIGYIFMIGFNDTTFVDQTASALRAMSKDAPLDGLIIDNRENVGGRNTIVEPIMGYFTEGVVGNFISRTETRPMNIVDNHDINGSQEIPLVILVGRGTASFGEIFSGALRDIGRAYIIGTTTDGNIETMWSFDFEDGSRMWLAMETFRPVIHPDENWEETGIIPDETVEGNWEEAGLGTDPPVLAALRYFDTR